MTCRLADLARDGTARLEAAGIHNPAREARLLLAHVSGLSAARLGAEMDEVAGPDVVCRMDKAVARRCAREPMSHIIGKRLFYKHEFQVTPDVLDPRPETEALVLAALEFPWASVLDLGTGSGAIILSLLAERAKAAGTATDLSPAALGVARANAEALGLAARCDMIQSDWFASVAGCFDLIVSNPPYIAEDEMPDLGPELSFEPRIALTDGADGLTAYRAICTGAGAHLVPGGWLMVEIGLQQGPGVAALMRHAGLVDVRILPDLDGRDRVVQGRASV
ncbi:peptide chain release factor N(5)-glutamine methyltransferase [Roseovarius arcticus]|uniref:peptide chain release factor N(5)-glutamine methyltransferase n=1 Tax=Roseovarius arcticus TaxID=2547404 RepID=UPI001110B226|nr:peptide chain release factor N(5)-glutamine methyltransferase [Roseovarius arcticus]